MLLAAGSCKKTRVCVRVYVSVCVCVCMRAVVAHLLHSPKNLVVAAAPHCTRTTRTGTITSTVAATQAAAPALPTAATVAPTTPLENPLQSLAFSSPMIW